jgi:hypothetical protein
MSKIMAPILDELNKGKRVEHMLETLTGQARQDFITELADLICAYVQGYPPGSTPAQLKIIIGYLNKRYPLPIDKVFAAPTPTPAAAPVKEFDPFNL